GDLEMGHARAMLTLSEEQQVEVARLIVAKGLSVRQAEALVRRVQAGKPEKEPTRIDPDLQRLQTDLSETLGAAVRIDDTARGKGRLVIQYNSLDEVDGILAKIH